MNGLTSENVFLAQAGNAVFYRAGAARHVHPVHCRRGDCGGVTGEDTPNWSRPGQPIKAWSHDEVLAAGRSDSPTRNLARQGLVRKDVHGRRGRPQPAGPVFRAGVRWIRPCRPDGTVLRMPVGYWVLREEAWTVEALRIVAPGSRHSILLFWTAGFREFLLWYVNLEDPMVRTPSVSTTWIVYSTLS